MESIANKGLKRCGSALEWIIRNYFNPPHFSTLLYSTQFYSTRLYFTLLYSTLLYSTILYSTLLYSTLLNFTLLDFTLLFSTLLYSTLYYTTLCYSIVTRSGSLSSITFSSFSVLCFALTSSIQMATYFSQPFFNLPPPHTISDHKHTVWHTVCTPRTCLQNITVQYVPYHILNYITTESRPRISTGDLTTYS